jgi:hypothetical protein
MEASTEQQAKVDAASNGHGDEEAAAAAASSPDIIVSGTGEQLTLQAGGKRPTGSSLRLVGGKIDIEGQLTKGEVVRFEVECQVTEVAFRDSRDGKTGNVASTDRAHKATIIGAQRVE